jgi:hypothetical protein
MLTQISSHKSYLFLILLQKDEKHSKINVEKNVFELCFAKNLV